MKVSLLGTAFLSLSGLLTTVAALQAQTPTNFVPTFTLEIADKKNPISANLPSPMIEGTIGCLADGSLVVHSFLDRSPTDAPDTPNAMKLSVISPSGTVKGFDVQQVGDVKKPQDDQIYDVGTADVVLLISSLVTDSGTSSKSEKRLLARFDRGGTYHGSIPLDLRDFDLAHVAVFDNGDFLFLGLDTLNRLPELARYSESEQKLTPYQPDTPLAKSNPSIRSVLPPDDPHRGNSDTENYYTVKSAVDFSQFVHYKDSILLLQRSVGKQIYQLFSNGGINVITLPKQEGFTADSIVGSDEALYIRYVRNGTNSGRGEDAYILEISPTTGDVLKKIYTASATVWDVACVHNNAFRISKLKGEQTFQFFTANARAGR